MNATDLQDQFEQLQQRQQQKLEKRKLFRLETKVNEINLSQAFEVNDNLGLSIVAGSDNDTSQNDKELRLLEEQRERLRELIDETGRLRKLLSERDYEIKRLQRSTNSFNQIPKDKETLDLVTQGNGASDVVTRKINELNKKVREVSSEAENERKQVLQLTLKCQQLELELSKKSDHVMKKGSTEMSRLEEELKSSREKIKQSEFRLSEARALQQTQTKELQMAKKALVEESCEHPDTICQLLQGAPSNWRGRHVQIQKLHQKLRQLMSAQSEDNGGNGAPGSFRMHASTGRTGLAKLQQTAKELKESLEKRENDLKNLILEHDETKQKLEAARSRQKTLTNEGKDLKVQRDQLLEKARHDDELITSFMKQNECLKQLIDQVVKTRNMSQAHEIEQIDTVTQQRVKESKVIERLKDIITEKENQIQKMQEEYESNLLNKRPSSQNFRREDPSPSFRLSAHQSPTRVEVDESLGIESVKKIDSSRPPSGLTTRRTNRSCAATPTKMNENDVGGGELEQADSLLRAAEVERDRLRELVNLQELKFQDILELLVNSERKVGSVRRRVAFLERMTEKRGTSNSFASSETPSQLEVERLTMEDQPLTRDSQRSLQDALSMAAEEVDAVKRALQSALNAKKEDIRMLTEIVSQNRLQYLQSVRGMKQIDAAA